MNNFFASIIEFFKKVFNISTEAKDPSDYKSDYFNIDGISITAALAERLSTLTLSDSTINIIGNSERAKYLSKFFEWVGNTKLPVIAQVCLGTGDCIVKPNTDGVRIGIDIIPNEQIVIVDSTADFLKAVLIKCDEAVKDNSVYERWEYHRLNQTADGKYYVTITQVCFKDGREISIKAIPAWADIKENAIVPNADRLLFGRFKCPKVNRKDVNSANGVPITSGAEYIVEQAKEAYARFNDEFDKSEKFIFADKRVFKTETVKNGNGTKVKKAVLPKGKESVIMDVNGSMSVDGQPLIHEFNPSIRDANLENGINLNLKMLEIFCGLDTGLLSKSENNYVNLDETRKSTQNTFAFITKFRDVIENGLQDLAYAVNVICNYNNITPMGDYTIDCDWSDSFVENMAERFNQMYQCHSLDDRIVTAAELRSWVMSIPLDTAEKQIEENTKSEEQQEQEIVNVDEPEIIENE